MDELRAQILSSIQNLNVNKSGTKRSPHKPLLLLLALSKLQQGEDKLPFQLVEQELLPLLKAFAPPVIGSHQPELPYWYLQSDQLWTVSSAETMPRQSGGFPRMAGIRQSEAGFPREIADYLSSHPDFTIDIINNLLEEYFPISIQEELVSRLSLSTENGEEGPKIVATRRRDPSFRNKILRAYEYRCAVTGFQAALGGSFFGCEAAHVRWHAYGGPDSVANGICLEPTLHKLFDAGAWTLDDNHRILVSKDFTGSETAVHRLRDHHGKPLKAPVPGEPAVDLEFITWHREPELGGVFRHPALNM